MLPLHVDNIQWNGPQLHSTSFQKCGSTMYHAHKCMVLLFEYAIKSRIFLYNAIFAITQYQWNQRHQPFTIAAFLGPKRTMNSLQWTLKALLAILKLYPHSEAHLSFHIFSFIHVETFICSSDARLWKTSSWQIQHMWVLAFIVPWFILFFYSFNKTPHFT